jgi:endonuclease-8
MPEGNVIHNQARRLNRAFAGCRVRVDSPQGRFAESAALLDRRTLKAVEAHGKHLFIGFTNDQWIHVHLGLFGKWRIGKLPEPDIYGQVRLRIRGNGHYAELRGPTICELLHGGEKDAVVARIGPDPIRAESDPRQAWAKVQRSKAAIGSLLMNQQVFAGVGNIYRAEVLFRHNISPFRPGSQVRWAEFEGMWDDLVDLMKAGTRRGRIDTVRPEHMPEVMGRRARRDRHGGEVYVYRRAGKACYLCETEIEMTDMQGRKLYWCPSCQPA